MRRRAKTGPRKLSVKRRILSGLVTLLLCFLALELLVRISYGIVAGPDALLYGFRSKDEDHTVKFHENQFEGYSKYFPNENKTDRDPTTGETFRVTVNSKGFRGREFTEQKKPGVIRVVTLGASSTFGYYDRDDETYPFYMERELNEQCGDKSFEVVNLGIPHSTSGQLLALFHGEALPLDPDVVTYYHGMADTSATESKGIRGGLRKVPVLRTIFRAVRDHFISVAFTDSFLKNQVKEFSKEHVENHLAGRSENFFNNVSLIHDECRKRGILFILATQQGRSNSIRREDIRGVTYQQEVELVRKKLASEGSISWTEVCFLTHAELMNNVESFAADRGIPFVDIIKSLDQRRDVLLSWVHVSPEGNRIIGKEFAGQILKDMCR